jgi:hypothetical protein
MASAVAILPNGTYSGTLQVGPWLSHFSVQVTNGVGRGTVNRRDCGSAQISFRVDPTGNVNGEGGLFESVNCAPVSVPISGRVEGGRVLLSAMTGHGGGGWMRREIVLSPGGGETTESTASSAPAAPIRTSASFVEQVPA